MTAPSGFLSVLTDFLAPAERTSNVADQKSERTSTLPFRTCRATFWLADPVDLASVQKHHFDHSI